MRLSDYLLYELGFRLPIGGLLIAVCYGTLFRKSLSLLSAGEWTCWAIAFLIGGTVVSVALDFALSTVFGWPEEQVEKSKVGFAILSFLLLVIPTLKWRLRVIEKKRTPGGY